ncbi:hypothetical protein [Magnetospirillum fulvum]|uniref:hypothetical protein n=1 Tax=Magnetospirillum fulvum TaxID=1082 RepID=UPI0011153375|nr:hypothetical protein [Magnetospirillum fulvum]
MGLPLSGVARGFPYSREVLAQLCLGDSLVLVRSKIVQSRPIRDKHTLPVNDVTDLGVVFFRDDLLAEKVRLKKSGMRDDSDDASAHDEEGYGLGRVGQFTRMLFRLLYQWPASGDALIRSASKA